MSTAVHESDAMSAYSAPVAEDADQDEEFLVDDEEDIIDESLE
jgi:hypothetical protein